MKPPPEPIGDVLSITYQLTTQASDRLRKGVMGGVGPVEMLGRIRRHGDVARMENGLGAQGPRVVLLMPDAVIVLTPEERRALRRPMDPARRLALFRRASAFALAWPVAPAELWPGATVVGREKIRGVACDLWELREKGPLGSVFQAWMPAGEKKGYALRLRADSAVPLSGTAPGHPEHLVRTVDALRISRSRAGLAEFSVPKNWAVQFDNSGGFGLAPSSSVLQPR